MAAWVFFRASTMDHALAMLWAVIGGNGLHLPAPLATLPQLVLPAQSGGTFQNGLLEPIGAVARVAILLSVAVALPNSQQILARWQPAYDRVRGRAARLQWRPTVAWGIGLGVSAAMSLTLLGGKSPFRIFGSSRAPAAVFLRLSLLRRLPVWRWSSR